MPAKASKAKPPVKTSKPTAKGKKTAKTAVIGKPSKTSSTPRKGGKCGPTPTGGKKAPQRAVNAKQTAPRRPRKTAPPVRRDVTVKLRWPHDWHCPSPNAVLVVSPCGTRCTVTAEPGRYELHAVRTAGGFICDPVEASVVTVVINPPPKEKDVPQPPAPIPVSDLAVQSPKRDEFKWYVLACVPGEEAKVKNRLNKHLALAGLKSFVKRVLLARKRVVRQAEDGRPYYANDKAFPGYLLIHMHFTPDVEKTIKKTYGALQLLMPKPKPKGRVMTEIEKTDIEMWQPEAVDTEEMAIVLLEEMSRKAPPPAPPTVEYRPGDRVIVTAGLLMQAEGRVVRIKNETVVISTKLLGREVQHTVKPYQCRKA